MQVPAKSGKLYSTCRIPCHLRHLIQSDRAQASFQLPVHLNLTKWPTSHLSKLVYNSIHLCPNFTKTQPVQGAFAYAGLLSGVRGRLLHLRVQMAMDRRQVLPDPFGLP